MRTPANIADVNGASPLVGAESLIFPLSEDVHRRRGAGLEDLRTRKRSVSPTRGRVRLRPHAQARHLPRSPSAEPPRARKREDELRKATTSYDASYGPMIWSRAERPPYKRPLARHDPTRAIARQSSPRQPFPTLCAHVTALIARAAVYPSQILRNVCCLPGDGQSRAGDRTRG